MRDYNIKQQTKIDIFVCNYRRIDLLSQIAVFVAIARSKSLASKFSRFYYNCQSCIFTNFYTEAVRVLLNIDKIIKIFIKLLKFALKMIRYVVKLHNNRY